MTTTIDEPGRFSLAVGGPLTAFAPLLLANSILLSVLIGDRIWHAGAKLPQFKFDIAAVAVFLMVLVLSPLVVFVPMIGRARRAGLRTDGVFASHYVDDFTRKWHSQSGSSETLLGSADIQSLADLAGSFDIVRETRSMPFGKDTLIQLAVIIGLPLAPLVLTMIPLSAIINRLVKLVQ